MKKLLLYIFIALLLSGVFQPLVVSAQTPSAQSYADSLPPFGGRAEMAGNVEQARIDVRNAQTPDAKLAAEKNLAASQDKLDNANAQAAGGCNLAWNFNLKTCAESILAWLGNVVLMIASRTLWLAGLLMDMSISYGINMGKILKDIPIV